MLCKSKAAAYVFLWLKSVFDYCMTKNKEKIGKPQKEEEKPEPREEVPVKVEEIKEKIEESEISELMSQLEEGAKGIQ